MADAPDKRDDATQVGKVEFNPDFEANTLVYDPNTSSPPRLIDPSAAQNRQAPPPKPPKPKEAEPPPASAERVAHFRILSKIGEGGMGQVYRASDEYLQRLVALKVLGSGSDGKIDEENTQRLLREARAASRINHQNVVTVYAAGEDGGVPFIAMEYVEGTDLSKLLQSGALDTARALELTIQIAEGLAAAHDQGIVHRDIKPANVLVCTNDRVKILDFGLAKPWRLPDSQPSRSTEEIAAAIAASESALNFYHTQAGVIWGSLRYMSPEQLTGDRVDARSDIFSLGIVLYEMLTGQVPFSARKPREHISLLLKADPPPLRKFNMRIPDAVQAIVSAMLAKDRDLRYNSAHVVASDLRTALARFQEFGDLEFEDLATGALKNDQTNTPKGAAVEHAASPAAPGTIRYDRDFDPDLLAFYPEDSRYAAVIISSNHYDWSPRENLANGSYSVGSALQLYDAVFEVVAIDLQRDNLVRYFLSRWPDHAIVRRIGEYSIDVVRAASGA